MLKSIKSFFKQTFIYGLVGSFRSFVEFLLLPIYARYLLPAQFGQLDIILVFSAVITSSIIFELTNGVFRFYYDDLSADYRRRLISTVTLYHIGVSAAALAILSLFSGQLAVWLLGNAGGRPLILIAGLAMFLNCAFTLPINLFRLQNRPAVYAILSFIQIGVAVAGTIIFVAYKKMGVEGVILARLLSMAPTLLACFWIQRSSLRFQFDLPLLGKVARFAAPLIPVGSAIWIINGLNRVFLLRFCSLQEVGFFSVGVKFTIFLTLMVLAFQLAWPQFAFSKMNTSLAGSLFARIFSYFTAASIWMVIFIGLFGELLLKMQTTSDYLPAAKLMFPLALAMMFYGIFYIFTTGLNISRKTAVILLPIAVGFGVNIALNILITPKFGALAVAWITMITYLLMSVITFIAAQRIYFIPFEWAKLGRCFIAGILIGIVARFLPNIQPHSFSLRIVLFMAFPALLLLFGFFDKSEKQAITKKLTLRHGQKIDVEREREYADSHFY